MAARRALATGRVLTVIGLLGVAAAYARAISFTPVEAVQGLEQTSSVRPRHRAQSLLKLMDQHQKDPFLAGARESLSRTVQAPIRLRTG